MPMSTSEMDYLFEDATGNAIDTDLCDIHDRRFLRVRKTLVRTYHVAVQVFDLGKAPPDAFTGSEYYKLSRAVLGFPGAGSVAKLATVKYDLWNEAIPVEQYLRKPLLSSRSSSRTFSMSDHQDYKWSSRDAATDREWTCTSAQGYLVAHYDLKPSAEPAYKDSSGNTLTICRSFTHLTVEIVTSLILMRQIAQSA